MKKQWEFVADAAERVCKVTIVMMVSSVIVMGLSVVPVAWLVIYGGETAFRIAMIMLIAGFLGWAIFSIVSLVLVKVHEWAFDKFVDTWSSRQATEI